MTEPRTVEPESRPKLPRYVKLRFDKTRDCWVLLAPERVLMPDETAVAVLQHLDGTASVSQIAERLAQDYDANAEDIAADITPMLQDLAEKGFIEL